MTLRSNITNCRDVPALDAWRSRLLDRRRFLLGLAGGSLSLLLPLSARAESEPLNETTRWRLIGAVQDRLFPSEPEAPGAREINAQAYLRWVVGDANIDAEERAFILRGGDWLNDLAQETHGQGFSTLSDANQEALLERIARSEAGEHWLSTLLLYLLEALLSDPIYGGNPDGIGWRWLQHQPGFPRPDARNRYRAG
jgi:gluconate 2-dehydrogenase gamma chain